MRFIRFGQVVGVCVLLAGVVTSATKAEEPKGGAEYWPFAEGNTWSFETTVQGQKIKQVVTVTKISVTDGKTRAELEYKTDGKAVQKEIYESDGKTISRLASGANATNKLTPALQIVQFPLTAGKQWDWKGEIAMPTATFKASAHLSVSGPEKVTTKAGEFSAMKVHLDLDLKSGEESVKASNDYWFAPNVGLIKQSMTIGDQAIEGVLTSYKLAK